MILFSHIGKTAGKSVIQHFKNNWGEAAVRCQDDALHGLKKISDGDHSGVKFVGGHFGYREDFFQGEDIQWITMVREPVEIVESLYSHIMGDPSHGLHVDFNRMKVTPRQFVEEWEQVWQCNQVKALAHGRIDAFEAIQNLEKFRFIGVVDLMKWTTEAMNRTFGLSGEIPRAEECYSRKVFPESLRSKIARKQSEAYRVFGYAVRRLHSA